MAVLGPTTLTPKSLTVAVPCAAELEKLSKAELLMGAGCGGGTPTTLGTIDVAVTENVAAGEIVGVVPLVVMIEVGIVPRLHTRIPPAGDVGQVPGLGVAEPGTNAEFGLSVSVSRTPATGSPVL